MLSLSWCCFFFNCVTTFKSLQHTWELVASYFCNLISFIYLFFNALCYFYRPQNLITSQTLVLQTCGTACKVSCYETNLTEAPGLHEQHAIKKSLCWSGGIVWHTVTLAAAESLTPWSFLYERSELGGRCNPRLCSRLEAGPASPSWELRDSSRLETRLRSMSRGCSSSSNSSDWSLVVAGPFVAAVLFSKSGLLGLWWTPNENWSIWPHLQVWWIQE